MMKTFKLFFALMLFSFEGITQPFINEINQFRRMDSLQAPPKDPILLIGSSSFTNWKDVQEYFPEHTLLNRGFGGSSLPHLLLYAEEVIFKYNPKQIIIYCGENDLSGGAHITADSILNRVKSLHTLIRNRLPAVPIVYISMKPSPSRRKYLSSMKTANEEIAKFMSSQSASSFLDVFTPMLTPAGEIRGELFISDSLHMNKKGYQLWQPLLNPYLLKSANHYYPASDKRVNIMGRHQKNSNQSRLWASGATITIKFKGRDCFLDVEDEQRYGSYHNYLTIVIDGKVSKRIKLQGKRNRVILAENLSPEKHVVTVCKDTEAGIGYIQINGVVCEKLLNPSTPPKRRIEFIGNSITCGMGSDQRQVACKQGAWYDQHNAWEAYGPTVARSLNAQWHLTSESGIGLMKSCCNKTITMPQVFDKINVNGDSLSWNFSNYTPQLVSICLGQNDGIQDSAIFIGKYLAFIGQVRKAYPKATLLLLTSPMADESLAGFLGSMLTAINKSLAEKGDKKVFMYRFMKRYIGGCDAHPSLEEHKQIANEVATVLKKIMRNKWRS
jgi:lysophospholipase L1-like esterase